MTDWNQNQDRATLFKGYFEIFDGATPYRFKQLVDITKVVSAQSETHYSDDGEQFKDYTGHSSSFSFTIDKTADLFDTANPPTNIRTISYFQDQIMTKHIIPEARFRGVNVTESTSENTVTDDFDAFIEDIEDIRSPNLGVYRVRISGGIKKPRLLQRS